VPEEDNIDETFSYEMPNLNVPNPPPHLSYPDFEDFLNKEILKANGIALSETELLAAIEKTNNILQASAVHTLGSLGSKKAINPLSKLLNIQDDYVEVEAAYALARLGIQKGKDTLIKLLSYPLDAYTAPPIAAGYLAILGDPRGFPVIVRAFGVDLDSTKVSACKQLFFFVPYHGAADAEGNAVNVINAFDMALKEPNEDVQWQALVQLREIDAPGFCEIVENYKERTQDQAFRDIAGEILTNMRTLA